MVDNVRGEGPASANRAWPNNEGLGLGKTYA